MLAGEWEGIEEYLTHLRETLLHEVLQIEWEEFQALIRNSVLDVHTIQKYDIRDLCRWSTSGLFGATASFMSQHMGDSIMRRWGNTPRPIESNRQLIVVYAKLPLDTSVSDTRRINPLM